MTKTKSPLPHENWPEIELAKIKALERIAYASERIADAVEAIEMSHENAWLDRIERRQDALERRHEELREDKRIEGLVQDTLEEADVQGIADAEERSALSGIQ